MKLADVSVQRPVFALMMTAALIVLGAFSYRDARPRPDAEDRRRRSSRCRSSLPGASAEEIETQITKRIEEAVNTISGIDELRASSDQGNVARHHHLHARARHRSRRRRTCATRSRTIVGQFPRDTRPPRHPEDRSRRAADPRPSPSTARARRRSSPRSPTSRSSRCSRPSQDVGSVSFNGERKREIQLLLNADRLNAYGLTVDQVRTAVAAAERRDSRRQLHRRPGRSRAADDGPHRERRRLQPDHPRLPRRLGRSPSATSAASQDSVQEVRSATRAQRHAGGRHAGPQAVGHQHRRGGRPRAWRGWRRSSATLPPDLRSASATISRASSAGRSRTSRCT